MEHEQAWMATSKTTIQQHVFAVIDLVDVGHKEKADTYLAELLEREGQAAYDAVLRRMAEHYGTPE